MPIFSARRNGDSGAVAASPKADRAFRASAFALLLNPCGSPTHHSFRNLSYAALTIASRAAADSDVRCGSLRRCAVNAANADGFRTEPLAPEPPEITKASTANPDQLASAARLSTSGRFPCDIRVNVDALTPASAATCFQFRRFAARCESSAA